MTNSIEQRLAGMDLPQPTPNLDRRIENLLAEKPTRQPVPQKQQVGVLTLVGGLLAFCLIGLVFNLSDLRIHDIDKTHRRSPVPNVQTVEVFIPDWNLSLPETEHDQDRLLPSGTIVISTSIPEGE